MRLVFLSLFFIACGTPTVLEAKSYATDCTMSSECVGVFLGDQCPRCSCPNAAISAREKIIYEADRSAAIAACGERPAVSCAPCAESKPTCQRLANPLTETRPTFCELR
jgi:hypothetical protein